MTKAGKNTDSRGERASSHVAERTFNKRQQQTTTNRNWLQTKIPTLTIEAWLSGHWQEPGLGVPKSVRATGTGPEVHSFA